MLKIEQQQHTLWLSFNRPEKHNAFDHDLLQELCHAMQSAAQDATVRVVVIAGVGAHFSAGADLNWMRAMGQKDLAANKQDARVLADALHAVYMCPKPVIAKVQGMALGGGAGIVAACDFAVAATDAKFAFSEVRLGIIPAVISPYVVKAIGTRMAASLFMSAERIDAARAQALQLITHCVPAAELEAATRVLAEQIMQGAPEAVCASKALARSVATRVMDASLLDYTADLIAAKRLSKEGQDGISAFLNKTKPQWLLGDADV